MLRRNFLILAAGVLAGALAFAGAPTYYPPAIGDFDGVNDYLTRGSDLTGNANGKEGIFSVWFRVDGRNAANRDLVQINTARFRVRLTNGNKFNFVGSNTVPALIFFLASNTAIAVDSTTWRHVVASWDLLNGTAHVYVDDAEDKAAGGTFTNDNIDYTATDWGVGAYPVDGSNKWDGPLAEFYFAQEFLDFSVTANRRKFIDANGFPVDLGPSGYKPTGTAPIIYMRTQFNNAGLNSGTGGDFTINGSPAYSVGPVPFPLTTWAPSAKRGRSGRGGRSRIH